MSSHENPNFIYTIEGKDQNENEDRQGGVSSSTSNSGSFGDDKIVMPIDSDVVFLDDSDDEKLLDKDQDKDQDNEEPIAKEYHGKINDDDYDYYCDSDEEDEDLETEEFKIQEKNYLKNNSHASKSPSEIIELLDSDDSDDDGDENEDEEDNDKENNNILIPMNKRPYSIFSCRKPLTSSANTSKKPKNISQTLLFDFNAHQKKTVLSQQTKAANKEERDRLRMLNNLKFYGSINSNNEDDVINSLRAPEDSIVRISPEIFQNMKPHQIEAVRFMWKNIVGSISVLKQSMNASILLDEKPGSSEQSIKTKDKDKDSKKVVASSGCVLAHCMGLGKTFSVVSFTVTLLTNPEICYGHPGKEITIFNRVLVVVPVNTLENWRIEYKKWTPAELNLQVYLINSNDNTAARFNKLKKWYEGGGVCIIGYNMFLVMAVATEAKVFNLNSPAAVSSSLLSSPSPAAAASVKDTALNLSGNKKDTYADSLFEVFYYTYNLNFICRS